jgi:hypothetical protein
LGKRTRETAVIARTGKALGDLEPCGNRLEKTVFYQGKTPPEGRLKLYGKLKAGDKACLEAGNPAFIVAKEAGGDGQAAERDWA